MTILVGDVGGTNISLAVVEYRNREVKIILRKTYESGEYNKFYLFIESILEDINKNNIKKPEEACFAVAGPVVNQKCKLTKVDLFIDSNDIKDTFGFDDVLLINDFSAIAYCIPLLSENDFFTLNQGKKKFKGAIAVIGAGTGIGKNVLNYCDAISNYVSYPSEGGHADCPLREQDEIELLPYFKRKNKGTLTYDDLITGPGLENIYNALQQTRYMESPRQLTAIEIASTKGSNTCSKETFKLFSRLYGRCCKNYMLETLCSGGLYIAGGIAGKNLDIFGPEFKKELINHTIFRKLLEEIPVHVITNYDKSLAGAAYALKNGNAIRW